MTWSQLSRVRRVCVSNRDYSRRSDQTKDPQRYQLRKVWTMLQDFGALCAGWTPVPLPEPLGSLRDKPDLDWLALDCAADVVLTTSQAKRGSGPR